MLFVFIVLCFWLTFEELIKTTILKYYYVFFKKVKAVFKLVFIAVLFLVFDDKNKK